MRNSRMEKMFRHKRMTTKQRTVSFVVLLAMIFALPMWSMAEDLRGQGNLTTVDIADAGQPGGAFEQVKISVGTVSEGQKATKFSVSMDLDNDSYTEGAATNDEFFKP